MDNDSCYPAAVVGSKGEVNKGIDPPRSEVSDCQNPNFLEHSNTYHRYACTARGGVKFCGHIFAYYFEKETVGYKHAHDFQYVIIWTEGDRVTYVSAMSHLEADTKSINDSDVAKEGTNVKFVLHTEGSSRHAIRFAGRSKDRVEENKKGFFVLPDVVSWYTMTCEGSDNAKLRATMNTLGFSSSRSTNPISDGVFLKNLNNARPKHFPEFNDESEKNSQ
ncbi:hypothetical protein Poli38472_009948 [Pythium oligandrum]|uniref:Uncharacterized protein n=1 Tax=Pythium oligandrum TaxID=41045 RepID=A0A8K1C827_PYTOL|nr:hypothetical protein Poli38472_009948 [Pythium oligandrum]|eukprot:TMW58389.1 hypothetical protein Poli38472_009948 [Pythium oligandrum]